ncbi:SANT domain-containing protein [Mycena indigotica]|uniref:SANT domain-containing protein n=1 Tax=Mycena indigotica TaxID=2126181 RepID=A0A8H6S617_9AGAR|nr:SANT domain-containing protein [Mycena indigotica]KAF7293062.1 SANT domain-containing protein [Mycena indigotica]
MDLDDPRAKTLNALKAFIDQQRALLTRTKADIQTLRKLKAESIVDTSTLSEQLNDDAFRLGEAEVQSGAVPEELDWSLLARKDPKPLTLLGRNALAVYTARNKPKPPVNPGLSELQKLVRNARKTIIDPVIALYGEPDDAPDANARPTPLRGPSGLFIRRTHQNRTPRRKPQALPAQPPPPQQPPDDARSSAGSSTIVDVDECPSPIPMALAKPKRTRRISTKLERQNLDRSDEPGIHTRRRSSTLASATTLRITVSHQKHGAIVLRIPPRSALPSGPLNTDDTGRDWTESEGSESGHDSPVPSRSPSPINPHPAPPSVLGKRRRPPAKAKPKSETFKLKWTTSEQNLLERLLEEIPDDDAQRYAKISRAMGGRRTPKQVNSRVQKYLLKLKQYGVI